MGVPDPVPRLPSATILAGMTPATDVAARSDSDRLIGELASRLGWVHGRHWGAFRIGYRHV